MHCFSPRSFLVQHLLDADSLSFASAVATVLGLLVQWHLIIVLAMGSPLAMTTPRTWRGAVDGRQFQVPQILRAWAGI